MRSRSGVVVGLYVHILNNNPSVPFRLHFFF